MFWIFWNNVCICHNYIYFMHSILASFFGGIRLWDMLWNMYHWKSIIHSLCSEYWNICHTILICSDALRLVLNRWLVSNIIELGKRRITMVHAIPKMQQWQNSIWTYRLDDDFLSLALVREERNRQKQPSDFSRLYLAARSESCRLASLRCGSDPSMRLPVTMAQNLHHRLPAACKCSWWPSTTTVFSAPRMWTSLGNCWICILVGNQSAFVFFIIVI